MILHFYECSKNHITEKLVTGDCPKKRCGFEGCRKLAGVVFLPRRQAMCPPTVIYINKEGKRLFPGRNDHPTSLVPEGFRRVEIPAHAVRRFEREMNQELNEEQSRLAGVEQEMFSIEQKHRHGSLRQDESQMDAFHKEISRLARESESEGYSKKYDAEFCIQAYS